MFRYNSPACVCALTLLCFVVGCHGLRRTTRERLVDAKGNTTRPTIDTWKEWMKSPPADAIEAYTALAKDADAAADSLLAKGLPFLGDVDVVYSGGGNLDAYAVGVDMVLSRLQAKTQKQKVEVQRYAGTSAGGMFAFDVVLKGERLAVASKIAMHLLLENKWFSDQAKYEKEMAQWQTQEYASQLSSLDDKVYLALNCIFQWKPLTIVHKYLNPDQARQAYLVTGGMGTYEGKTCVDGGSVSGKNMTPLFQDGTRPQLIVNLMAWGDGLTGVMDINARRFQNRITTGIKEAAEFLGENVQSVSSIATSHNKGITLCPKDAKVKDNVCKDKNDSWWR